MNRMSVAVFAALVLWTAPGCGRKPTASANKEVMPGPSSSTREIDAVTFLTAFRDGKGDEYKGFTVKGEGRNFAGGHVSISSPDGSKEVVLDLSIALIVNNKPVLVRTLKEWVQAEMSRTPRLDLELRGRKLEEKQEVKGEEPPVYSFSGRFAGETTSVHRTILIGGAPADSWLIPVLSDSIVR